MAGILIAACKLPGGIHLDVIKPVGENETTAERDLSKRLTLNGTGSTYVNGLLLSGHHGYGFTSVDADLFNAWLADHKDFVPVKNGLIFAEKDLSSAEKEANRRAGVKSGFEGMDPEKPAPGVEPATADA